MGRLSNIVSCLRGRESIHDDDYSAPTSPSALVPYLRPSSAWRSSNRGIDPPTAAPSEAAPTRNQSDHHLYGSDSRGNTDEISSAGGFVSFIRSLNPWMSKSTSDRDDVNENISSFSLYTNEKLSPRSHAWLYLTGASIAGLSSFLVVEDKIDDFVTNDLGDSVDFVFERNGADTFLLVVFSISSISSFLATAFYRHRTLRQLLTKGLCKTSFSLEMVVSVLLFALWCGALRYLFDPSSGVRNGIAVISGGLGGLPGDSYSPGHVWNATLWFSGWLALGLSSYLTGDLIMATPEKKRGAYIYGDECADFPRTNIEPCYYFMAMVFSGALSAFSIEMRKGDACAGNLLSSTSFCVSSLMGSVIGLLCGLFALMGLIIYRLDQMGTFDQWGSQRGKNLLIVDGILSILLFVLNCLNVGFGTSPGGQGTEVGNIFVSSWMALILSLIICERLANNATSRISPVISQVSVNKVNDEYLNDKVRLTPSSPSPPSSSSSSSGDEDDEENEESREEDSQYITEPSIGSHEPDLELGKYNKNLSMNETDTTLLSQPPTLDGSSSSNDDDSSSSGTSSSSSDLSLDESEKEPSSREASSEYSLPAPPRQVADEKTATPPPPYGPPHTEPSFATTQQHFDTVANDLEQNYRPPSPPFRNSDSESEDEPVDYVASDDEDFDTSGPEIVCDPYDDEVSSLDCSLMSGDHHVGKDPPSKYDEDRELETVRGDIPQSFDSKGALPIHPRASRSSRVKHNLAQQSARFTQPLYTVNEGSGDSESNNDSFNNPTPTNDPYNYFSVGNCEFKSTSSNASNRISTKTKQKKQRPGNFTTKRRTKNESRNLRSGGVETDEDEPNELQQKIALAYARRKSAGSSSNSSTVLGGPPTCSPKPNDRNYLSDDTREYSV
mmetsp:Transcript_2242/g.4825  ORF Transcript_2242/g.4825 Transcript_2242/m.4825 type:complete len:896 (+) Transcript_2242:130-2817(+)